MNYFLFGIALESVHLCHEQAQSHQKWRYSQCDFCTLMCSYKTLQYIPYSGVQSTLDSMWPHITGEYEVSHRGNLEMRWFMMTTEDSAAELVCTVPVGKPQ